MQPVITEDPLEIVRSLLPSASLLALNYADIHMHRKPGTDAVAQGLVFPSETNVAYNMVDAGVVYRFEVSVERPDLSVTVAVLVLYATNNMAAFGNRDVCQIFGERIALPAAYPFVRSKLFEVTTDCGAPAVLLNIIDLGRTNFSGSPLPPNAVPQGEAT